MTDYVIPCETLVRLTKVLQLDGENMTDWLRTVRIDNGVAICTNRKMMVMENIGGASGVIHIIADAKLIAQCAVEAPFNSVLTITVNEQLRFAVAKTTLGYIHSGNACLWAATAENDLERWHTIVDRCRAPSTEPKGVMFWDAYNIANLAASSPSGTLVFEEIVDVTKPIVIRDMNDPDWCGFFIPSKSSIDYDGAAIPEWLA
jgi:hypothetical protein